MLAEKQAVPLQDFLLLVLSDEIARRQTSASRRRSEVVGLDPHMVFERWDKTTKGHYDRRVLAELAMLRFIDGRRNVIVLGPVGLERPSSPTRLATSPATLDSRSAFIVPPISFASFGSAAWMTRATRS